MLRLSLITLMLVFFSCSSGEAQDGKELAYICLGNYVKNQNLLDDNLIIEDSTEFGCDALVTLYSTTFYANVRKKLEINPKIQDSVECIIEYMKTLKVAEISMNEVLIEESNKLSADILAEASKAVKERVDDKVTIATKLCLLRSQFNSRFMRVFFDMKSSSPQDEDEDAKKEKYCTRKSLIDNNFIDSSVYTVNLNPDSIDISEVECVRIMNKTMVEGGNKLSKIFSDLGLSASEEISRCVLSNIRTHNVFEAIVTAAVLAESGVSDEAAKDEEKLFSQKNILFFANLLSCYAEV